MNNFFKAILGNRNGDCPDRFDAKVDEVIRIFKRATSEELKAWKFPVSPEDWGRNLSEREKAELLQSRSD